MNERIRALMDQAVSFRLDPDSMGYEAQVSPEDLAAFAELIVRECANYFDNTFQEEVKIPPKEYINDIEEENIAEVSWRNGWLAAYEQAGVSLFEHFGVEE